MKKRTLLGLPLANSLAVGVIVIGLVFNLAALVVGVGGTKALLSVIGCTLLIPLFSSCAFTLAAREAGRRAPTWALPVGIFGHLLLITSILMR